eukprot:gene29063-21987_t
MPRGSSSLEGSDHFCTFEGKIRVSQFNSWKLNPLGTDFWVGLGVGTAAAAAYYAFYARPAQLSAAEVVTSQKASVQQAPAVAHDLSRYISNLTSRQLEATDLGGFYEVYPQHRKAFKKLSTFCNAYPEL